MEIVGICATVFIAVASGLAYLCQTRPRVAVGVTDFFGAMFGAFAVFGFGGLAAAIWAKRAVGNLAAGMYAGDYAITDGQPSTDEIGGGRYIIWRIASAVDPTLDLCLWVSATCAIGYVLMLLAGRFAKMVMRDDAEQRAEGGAKHHAEAEMRD